MAILPIRQASFVGGEIDPGLYARTNLRRFADSVRLLRNMIPLQEGPATNRPGLLYKGAARTWGGTGRLVPFIFGKGTLSNNFVLEIVPLTIRVWKNGVRLMNGPIAVEIGHDYTDEEISKLKFMQYGQMLTIFCKQRTPKDLTWITDTSWTLTDWSLARAITAPQNLTFGSTPPPGDATVSAKMWQIVVTAVKAETKEESLPSNYIQASMAINSNRTVAYQWDAVDGASEYNVYRGRNGKYGYIGTAIGRTTFLDDGQYPVFAEVPPVARTPFPEADDQPQLGTYHDQRSMVANAWNNPGEVEGSRIGETRNFDRAAPPKTTDAVTFNVASTQYEEIRNLVSLGRNLLVMTNAKEQLVTGNEGIIAQDDLVFDDMPTHWGSSWLDPLLIGDAVVFVQDVGATVREYLPLDKANSNDLTLVARHLFRSHSIVSWCYAHEPYRVIWAVREDGALLSCTYVKQLEQWAWARHDTAGDTFESICCVPEGNESAVYAMVRRTVGDINYRYIERLAPREGMSLANGVFLDSAITYTGAPASTIYGLTHLIGRTVYALADGVVRGPFTVGGQGEIGLPVPASTVHVGLRITAQGTTLDAYSTQEEIRSTQKNIKQVHMEVLNSRPFRAGQRLTDTLQLATRPDGLAWSGLYSGLVQININSDWDSGGAVVWEHTDPTPLTILSITREVDFGGR